MASQGSFIKRPTTTEFYHLIHSRKLRIYAQSCELPLEVPEALLAWYSPYFRAMVPEEDGVLQMRGEKAEFVHALIHYVLGWQDEELCQHGLEGDERLEFWADYVRFCKRYGVLDAATMIDSDMERHLKYDAEESLACTANLVQDVLTELHPQSRTVRIISEHVVDWLVTRSNPILEELISQALAQLPGGDLMVMFLERTESRNGARTLKSSRIMESRG